ncbi:beta-glucosidase [Microcoleus sp. FACHB-1515]|nr:beta-glucosidase [Microcoleus sp. FACHB-1515]
MLIVRASGHLFDQQIRYPIWEPPASKLQHWVQDLNVGGVILLGGSAAEIALRSQQLQDWATIPLLICADIEEGVGQRFSGATWFPPPLSLAAIDDRTQALKLAQQMGAITAQEALAIGLNWILAPVVDVNNNPDNPVINVRAFGETVDAVSELAIAFLQGMQQHPVLTCAKHFPGHGDTAVDSHLTLPTLPHTIDRLEQIELPPFVAAIRSNVDAVMSAHLQIPAIDPQYPATLSRSILTDLLRRQLGFDGLIVTDALVMGAIANEYGANEVPVLAIEAGADILMMPLDPEGAIQAVCAAVESGRISPERIAESIDRIWQAKQKVCAPQLSDTSPHAWETLPPPPIQLEQLATPDAIATAATILQASQRVHRPDAITPGGRNLIVVDDAIECDFLGSHTPAIALPAQHGYTYQLVDSHTLARPSDDEPPTLLQLFIRGNPFRGSAGLTQTAQSWVEALLAIDRLQALVIYGSPYLLEHLPRLPDRVPYVFTYGQMPQAQAIALEALFEAKNS